MKPSLRFPLLALALALAFLLPSPARAASPSFDCAKALSAAEKLICRNEMLAGLDSEVARLTRLAASDGAHTTEVEAGEKAWLAEREACGTNSRPIICLRDLYVGRIADLRRTYPVTRSADDKGTSLGPFAVACPDFAAPIGVDYVNVDPPLAYMTWRDEHLVMTVGPSGSGARYLAKVKGGETMLWTKGDQAIVQFAGQKERTCTIKPAE